MRTRRGRGGGSVHQRRSRVGFWVRYYYKKFRGSVGGFETKSRKCKCVDGVGYLRFISMHCARVGALQIDDIDVSDGEADYLCMIWRSVF